MQVKGPGLTIGRQQFPDVVHLLARLLSRFELLKRDQRRCQRFGDDPFVVAGNSLFWHDDPHPLWGRRSNSLTGIISPNRKSAPVPLKYSFNARAARRSDALRSPGRSHDRFLDKRTDKVINHWLYYRKGKCVLIW